jgi:hypothetical protein
MKVLGNIFAWGIGISVTLTIFGLCYAYGGLTGVLLSIIILILLAKYDDGA